LPCRVEQLPHFLYPPVARKTAVASNLKSLSV
jgi:hypothetical protein